MLRLFDRYYRKGDPKAMAVCAFQQPLFDHTDSSRTTALRSNSPRFQRWSIMYPNLRESARFLHFERQSAGCRGALSWRCNVRSAACSFSTFPDQCSDRWESLPDPEAPAPVVEPGLVGLFDEIRVTVGQEAQIITAVFPQPAVVMQVFLQRVFAQVVSPCLVLSVCFTLTQSIV